MARNRSRRRRRRSLLGPTAACESLENRVMLSATLAGDGVLTIEGTSGTDFVSVYAHGDNLVVFKNGIRSTFALADVTEIVANGNGGHDAIIISRNVTIPTTINGGAGYDFILGGAGSGTLSGGDGKDLVIGRDSDDTIDGGNDKDLLIGGGGNDTIGGGAGNDIILGKDGDDTASGGDGYDLILGNQGNDILDGGADKDFIFGGRGDDEIRGGAGNDKLVAGPGSDMLFGESGNDLLIGDSETDVLDGGEGDNKIIDRSSGLLGSVLDHESITESLSSHDESYFDSSYIDHKLSYCQHSWCTGIDSVEDIHDMLNEYFAGFHSLYDEVHSHVEDGSGFFGQYLLPLFGFGD